MDLWISNIYPGVKVVIFAKSKKKLLKKDALDLHKCVDIINKVNQQSINFIDW